jgi:hypothetical protein
MRIHTSPDCHAGNREPQVSPTVLLLRDDSVFILRLVGRAAPAFSRHVAAHYKTALAFSDTLSQRLGLFFVEKLDAGHLLAEGSFMNKTFNLIIMVLMFALAARQVYVISQVGANSTNVIFLLLFLAFAVRRLLIHNKLSK